jgi:glycosyltransferase involved in cell wall biosynthesis
MKSQDTLPHICYSITRGDWGGAQRYVFDLVRVFRNKARVTVIIGGNGSDALTTALLSLHHPNIQIIHIPSLVREIHPVNDWAAFLALKQTFKQLRPDIIHLNSTKVGVLGSLAATAVPHAKVVYTVHGWVTNEPKSPLHTWLYTKSEQWTKRQKDAYIVLSKNEATIGKQTIHIPDSSIHIIPNGIDDDISTPDLHHDEICAQMTQQKKQGDTVFLTIANFYTTKGLDILINAISEARLHHIHLYIVGDGPLRTRIEQQLAQHNLHDTITLLGVVPNAHILCTYADWIVIPSRKEGLPYVLLESLRANTPVIATAVGAIPEILNLTDGNILIPANDIPSLSSALRTAAQTKRSVASTTLPYQYTLDAMSNSTWSLYQSLLQ